MQGIFQYNNVLCSVISLEQAFIEHPFGQLRAPEPIASFYLVPGNMDVHSTSTAST